MPSKVMIEKGVPAPSFHQSMKYPLAAMELGDSFFAVGVTARSLHQCMRRHRPKRYIARKVVEAGVRGIRVWRVE